MNQSTIILDPLVKQLLSAKALSLLIVQSDQRTLFETLAAGGWHLPTTQTVRQPNLRNCRNFLFLAEYYTDREYME